MPRKEYEYGTSASQTRTFLANHFLSLDFGTELKTRTSFEPLKWTIRNGWQVSTPFFFGISSWSTCMSILSGLSWYRAGCHALWAYAAYVYLLHRTATKQYHYQINIAPMQCTWWKYTWLKHYVSHFPRSNPIICSAARLWPCLFSLAAPWKTAAISGGMPLAKNQSGGFTFREFRITIYDWHCFFVHLYVSNWSACLKFTCNPSKAPTWQLV